MRDERERLYAAVDGTWSPARKVQAGIWTLREGLGGGSRVSSATLTDPHRLPLAVDFDQAEEGMRDLGQAPLFQVRDIDHPKLDIELGRRGYSVYDPVVIYKGDIADLTSEPIPPVRAFTIWPPLAIMTEIWEAGGIGPARLAVMARAPGPFTAVFSRNRDKPAGVGYVAVDGEIAMLHALEVVPQHRKQGVANWAVRKAALWAAEHGAKHLVAICRRDNVGACALYNRLGMKIVGQYHYRKPPVKPS
ncbi:GNAT family N-acetyltransferase [Chachezhania sediminis]|uniref:GNAT family N-acetyltransferase n=1 Tax=Chachezhania sediminis TaxID=2599291 RepID=UPI00131A7169|nr:GNAT family N-acetyltransferase [Chachezhania sediminis]